MRSCPVFVCISLSLVGCGEVSVKSDAAVPIDSPVQVDAPPDAPPLVPRLYALSSAFSQGAALYNLEVVDLRDMSMIHHFPLGAGNPSSLVVSPDGRTAYVADTASGEVSSVNTTTGVIDPLVQLSGVRDLALSADGSKLYASASNTLVAIDTMTKVMTPTLSLGNQVTSLGMALSPDGQRLAAATTNGGSSPTVTLVRTSDMSIEAPVSIVTNVSGCAAFPISVAFSGNGLLVSWDSNCDELYQVDVGTHTQLTAGSIATGRDSGSGGFVTSRLAVSASTHLAYAVRENGDVAVMNPQTVTFTAVGGFTGMPQAIVSTASGDKIYVSVIHQFTTQGVPDTLDVLDTASTMFQRAAYTFMSGTQSVLDMAVVTAP